MSEERTEKLHIRLNVGDTVVPMRIYPEEEETYRKAASLIKSTVSLYTTRAQGKKSAIEILYMALIDIALKYERESQRNDTAPYMDVLTKLTAEIEDALGESKA